MVHSTRESLQLWPQFVLHVYCTVQICRIYVKLNCFYEDTVLAWYQVLSRTSTGLYYLIEVIFHLN